MYDRNCLVNQYLLYSLTSNYYQRLMNILYVISFNVHNKTMKRSPE